jgi:hypothetical protein
MSEMVGLAQKGISEIFSMQKIAIINADKVGPLDFASLIGNFSKKSL